MAEGGRPVIVVGYDGSATARAAVDYAAAQPGADGTLYVVHSYGPPPDWLGFPQYQRVLDDHQSRGRAILDALAMGDDAIVDTNFETELLDGPAADAINRVAETRDADAIVIGSRGLGPVRAALGSVSHQVLQHARVPVVVIPAASEE